MREDLAGTNDWVFRIFVSTKEQFQCLMDMLRNTDCKTVDRVYVHADLLLDAQEYVTTSCTAILRSVPNLSFFVALPEVLRASDEAFLGDLLNLLENNECFSGILSGTLEGIGYFQKHGSKWKIVADHNFYLWNRKAVVSWDNALYGACLPLELNAKEQCQLLHDCENYATLGRKSLVDGVWHNVWDKHVYYRIPLMYTANCVAKTNAMCKKTERMVLRDRTGTDFEVLCNCKHCFNVIYNSIPLSLHRQLDLWSSKCALRIHLTTENERESHDVLKWFLLDACSETEMPYEKYTNGHEKRGVL